jgi:hypothetical protein
LTENVARKLEPAPAPQAVPKPTETTIELTTEVLAFGTSIKKLTFRRPTGGDIMALGDIYPVNIDFSTGVVTPVPVAMGRIMSVLAQVPLKTIESMDSEDFARCAFELQHFFLPAARAQAT